MKQIIFGEKIFFSKPISAIGFGQGLGCSNDGSVRVICEAICKKKQNDLAMNQK